MIQVVGYYLSNTTLSPPQKKEIREEGVNKRLRKGREREQLSSQAGGRGRKDKDQLRVRPVGRGRERSSHR